MSHDIMRGCCGGIKGLKRLTLPDGMQIAIVGLDDILAAVYAEGRQANAQTAEQILERVAARNYIPSSGRQEYQDALLTEYRRYVARQKEALDR